MINHKKILICVWLGYGLTILALVGNSLGQGLSFFDSLLFMVGFTLPLLITSIIITLEVKKNYTNSSEKLEEVVEVEPVEVNEIDEAIEEDGTDAENEEFSENEKKFLIITLIMFAAAIITILVVLAIVL